MRSYVWIPFLVLLWSEVSVTTLANSPATILLPSQREVGVGGSSHAVRSGNSACSSLNPSLNYRPVIGILSHPGDGASGRLSNATDVSYIAASYVKFAEAGGARVIPLIFDEPEEVLFQKLELVNGVIFTGGWAKRGLYYETVKKIFVKALERNDGGENFPVYAISLGFELLAMIISQDRNILERFNAKNSASSLQFPENLDLGGTIFGRFPSDLLTKLNKDCLIIQNHKYGLSPGRLEGNPSLSSFFKILTTSIDENDQTYVSTVQSKRYPVVGFQWNPEEGLRPGLPFHSSPVPYVRTLPCECFWVCVCVCVYVKNNALSSCRFLNLKCFQISMYSSAMYGFVLNCSVFLLKHNRGTSSGSLFIVKLFQISNR